MPIVLTNQGNIKGRRSRTKSHSNYFAFYKIPYAKPPTGKLRFALPKQADPWSGTLDCSSRETSACLQVNVISPESKFLIGNEDCLHLNIYTPHLPEPGIKLILPVIVWFHGGAFAVGSNDHRLYGPDYLVDQGVVLVAVNYRLGPLGFFCLENDLAPGNQGLHDQALALKWVQDHISAFGGDKDNVTIMGESAGAMSCFMHLVSPLSRGLFHKIIALSGSASTPFLHYDRKPSVYAKALFHNLCPKNNFSDQEIIDYLRSVSSKSIVHRTTLFKDWDVANPLPWKPVIDNFSSKPFMPVPFEDAIRSGNFDKNVPIIAGFTSEEGLILSSPFHRSWKRWNLFFGQCERWGPLLFFNRETDLITIKDKEAVKKIFQKFFGSSSELGNSVPTFNEQNLKSLEQVFSTAVFQAPICKDLDLMVDHGVKVFAYNFTYRGSMTLTELFRLPTMKLLFNFTGRYFGAKIFQKKLGPCHGDDLLYLFPFNVGGFPKSLKTDSDKRVSKNLTGVFTNLAKHGDPTPEATKLKVLWRPLEKSSKKFLFIEDELKMGELELPMRERIEFWNEIVKEADHLNWNLTDQKISKLYDEIADKRSGLQI